jgi:hypothetical protein
MRAQAALKGASHGFCPSKIVCYEATMIELLNRAFERARALPDQRQDELGELLLAMVEQEQSSLQLSDAQRAEVARRLANPEPRVPEHEMKAFFRKLAG